MPYLFLYRGSISNPFPFAVYMSSYRSSLWSCNCPSRSFMSQLLWKLWLWPLKAASRQVKHGWKFTVTTSMLFLLFHIKHLWCQPFARAVTSLSCFFALRKEPSHTWIPWKGKRKYSYASSPIRDLLFWATRDLLFGQQPASACSRENCCNAVVYTQTFWMDSEAFRKSWEIIQSCFSCLTLEESSCFWNLGTENLLTVLILIPVKLHVTAL